MAINVPCCVTDILVSDAPQKPSVSAFLQYRALCVAHIYVPTEGFFIKVSSVIYGITSFKVRSV